MAEAAKARADALRKADPQNTRPLPADLLEASASGLDPDISPEAAEYQAARVAKARGLPVEQVRELIHAHSQGKQWGVFGRPRVNVLALNLALDALAHP